jgi:hypothetical protein
MGVAVAPLRSLWVVLDPILSFGGDQLTLEGPRGGLATRGESLEPIGQNHQLILVTGFVTTSG